MPSIGPIELVIVLVVVLVLFGAKRLPEAGRALGESMRGFKDSLTGETEASAELATAPDRAEIQRTATTAEERRP